MRDFFEHQDRARRQTLWLMVLFVFAVVVIIAMTYLVIAVAWVVLAGGGEAGGGAGSMPAVTLWRPLLLAVVVPSVVVLVFGASMVRMGQLRGGGSVVAVALGGRLVNPDTTDPDERRVLNVVEEMAIASGVPVPPVYVMDGESAINAFAAGYRPEDAAIGVTRGCIALLDRDQLQGVMAHEFSHILNGDMRLNLRLVGVLYGILVIGLLGQGVFRAIGHGSVRVRSGNRKGGGGAVLVIIAAAAALWVIGSVGVLAGNMIKAAVSRQREFLADASAVQFTRNPDGIAGALKRIGAVSAGSRLRAADAGEFNHMYFGEGVASRLGRLSATHPPLAERIRRIDPAWDGRFPRSAAVREVGEPVPSRRPASAMADAAAGMAGMAAVGAVGQPTPEHVQMARDLLAELPASLRMAAREPYSARAVVFALLLDDQRSIADRQLAELAGSGGEDLAVMARSLGEAAADLDPRLRLPLIDLAVTALRRLSPEQYRRFAKDTQRMVRADGRVDRLEWMLGRVLRRHLSPAFEAMGPPKVRYRRLAAVHDELAVVLWALARTGARDQAGAEAAVAAAVGAGGLTGSIGRLDAEACSLAAIDRALKALDGLAPRLKRQVITACAACVAADRKVSAAEGELMRAVADAIGVPMPPLLPGQALV